MLTELSKKDKQWRKFAVYICKDKYLADDIVNDMYLKLHDKKNINDWYVCMTIKSIFLDYIKQQKPTICIDDIKELSQSDNQTLQQRFMIDEALKQLTFFEREILLHTHEKSLRECEAETGVAYGVFNYHKKKALPKLSKILKDGQKNERI